MSDGSLRSMVIARFLVPALASSLPLEQLGKLQKRYI